MHDKPDLKAEIPKTPPTGSERAGQEQEMFAKTAEQNSVVIMLWKGGYISFNPTDSVSIFALLALVLLLLGSLVVVSIGLGIGDMGWMDRLTTALGHAITGVVGAIVGSAATKKK